METIPLNATVIVKESRQDPQIAQVLSFTSQGNRPSFTSPGIEPFFSRRHELMVQQGWLLWRYRIIIPKKLCSQLLDTLHIGHLGIVKMKNVARMYFWWPGLDKDIESTTKSCEGCSYHQPDPQKAPLHPWQWSERPWERIHIDFAGSFMNNMFLIILDAHTKWAEVFPVSSTQSSSTIEFLTETFSRFGIPNIIANGSTFTLNEFKDFTKGNGIKHITTAPFHPATNGLAERFVKSFKIAMKAAKNDTGTLSQKISRFLFAYRNAPQSTTHESPALLCLEED
ncbi:DDE-type integrase/transposase/recombinase [Biomphalaria pfeifferi]|uniref:DDE-type integrase/transposase/recombinase n=1 Tax=Biomphalaria pfeifferi TaxID=112525 RepID=A0AAD8BKJ9_BIOPF|nr:DDE-type integrase/transposase/recombinase [Biomphalaria pfeifferi]